MGDSVQPPGHEKLPITGPPLPAIGSNGEQGSVSPEIVLAGLLGGIDEWVLDEFERAVDAFDAQGFGVQGLVVMGAQGDAVISAGLAVVRPELYVV